MEVDVYVNSPQLDIEVFVEELAPPIFVDIQDPKDIGKPGTDGKDGKSAYQSYVDTLPEGEVPLSEAEWVQSLEGTPGQPGPKGDTGGSTSLWEYNYSSALGPSPATGSFRANSANTLTATKLYIHKIDLGGADRKPFLITADTNATVYIQDMDNSDAYVRYVVTADAVDNGSYVTISVLYQEGFGTLVGNNKCLMGVVSTAVPTLDQVVKTGNTAFDMVSLLGGVTIQQAIQFDTIGKGLDKVWTSDADGFGSWQTLTIPATDLQSVLDAGSTLNKNNTILVGANKLTFEGTGAPVLEIKRTDISNTVVTGLTLTNTTPATGNSGGDMEWSPALTFVGYGWGGSNRRTEWGIYNQPGNGSPQARTDLVFYADPGNGTKTTMLTLVNQGNSVYSASFAGSVTVPGTLTTSIINASSTLQLQAGGVTRMSIGSASGSGMVNINQGSSVSNVVFFGLTPAVGFQSNSGYQIGVNLTPTISQSGASDYYVLRVMPVESSVGSGIKRLIQAGTSGRGELFGVDNTGKVNIVTMDTGVNGAYDMVVRNKTTKTLELISSTDKQDALSGTGIVESNAGVISYNDITGTGSIVKNDSPTFATKITTPLIELTSMPVTSTGPFDILTVNTSTNEVEKIATTILTESTQIIITTAVNIDTTTTDSLGLGQKGRSVVIDNGANNIVYNINATDGFTAGFVKHGTGTITFTTGLGRTLKLVDGISVLNGTTGSTAMISSVGLTDYLRISNA